MTYRNACISLLARLKKRPPASRSEDTGTMESFESTLKERQEKEKGELKKERVEGFVHDEETLRKFGYLLEVPEGEGGDIPNEAGQKRVCDRCKGEFVVKNELTHVSLFLPFPGPSTVSVGRELILGDSLGIGGSSSLFVSLRQDDL